MGHAPLKLNWGDLLPYKDKEEPPAEVVVVSNGDERMFANLSDHQIGDKIGRLNSLLATGANEKLGDKGTKLRSSILHCQQELDRRKRMKDRRDTEKIEKASQSPATELSGLDNDIRAGTTVKSQQSSFASIFSKKLEEKADFESNGEWKSISRDNCEISRKNGKKMNGNRQRFKRTSLPSKVSHKTLPFQSANSLLDRDTDCRRTRSSGSHPSRRSVSNSSFKRCKVSGHSASDGGLRKVQHVVLLDDDDEDVEPELPVQGDTPEKSKETRIYYPSRDDPECVELSYADLKCLEPHEYLTSPIMNFYIRYLQKPLSPTGQPRGDYYFFNTFFYIKLEEAVSCKADENAPFSKLRRWWKGVNIFQKAYIFLPIHGDMHWSLVIICIPAKEDESGPIVLHLDSLEMHSSSTILDVVVHYLIEEWDYINKNGLLPDLPISESIWSNLPQRIEKKTLRVPQQENVYDCGLFVLYFMERFIDEAPDRLKRKDLAMFGGKWFQPEEASGLRKRIKDLLIEEFENARLESGMNSDSPSSSSLSEDEVQHLSEV